MYDLLIIGSGYFRRTERKGAGLGFPVVRLQTVEP